MWKLRINLSLCKLLQAQEESAAAHSRLAEVYGWFPARFHATDLQVARTLLATLA